MRIWAALFFALFRADDDLTFNFDPSKPGYEHEVIRYVSQFGGAVTNDPDFFTSSTADDLDIRGLQLEAARPASAVSRPDPTRMLRQLKLMVVGMMDPAISEAATGTGFGRYCYYGCHCLPDKDHSEHKVYGKPVDNIDNTCRDFGTCYKCIAYKYSNQCVPERTPYKFRIRIKKATGERQISCAMNPENTCERDTCECDKFFSTTVAKYEHEWIQEYHITRGNFDRKKSCRAQHNTPVGKSDEGIFMMDQAEGFVETIEESPVFTTFGGLGFDAFRPNPFENEFSENVFFAGPEESQDPIILQNRNPIIQSCCGIDDFPNVSIKKNPKEKCCGKLSYDDAVHRCCPNKELKYGNEICD